jgi:hypothetical protein
MPKLKTSQVGIAILKYVNLNYRKESELSEGVMSF